EGTSGKKLLLLKEAPKGCEAPREIEVRLAYNPEKAELLFAYDFDLLPPFKGKNSVTIEQSARWRGKAEDGIYSVKLGRLTLGYHLRYRFTPEIRDDRVLFVWRSLWKQYQEEEKKPGIVDLSGWLLPGNGVCLAYTGTGRKSSINPAETASDVVR